MKHSFSEAMRRLASTVNIITCSQDGMNHGMTATAVTSLCAEPASLLICVNTQASIAPIIKNAENFCVNILASHHQDVSSAFSGRLKGQERFNSGEWKTASLGLPYLVDAQANVFCKLDSTLCYGTHDIYVGLIEDIFLHGIPDPLLYGDGSYRKVHPLAA